MLLHRSVLVVFASFVLSFACTGCGGGSTTVQTNSSGTGLTVSYLLNRLALYHTTTDVYTEADSAGNWPNVLSADDGFDDLPAISAEVFRPSSLFA